MVPLHMAGVSFSQTGETGFHSIWDAAIVSGDNESGDEQALEREPARWVDD